MKSQTQKKNAPKAKSKAPEPPKKAQAKVALVETATAAAAPPLSTKKVAKAPAVALKNLGLAMKETAKKAGETADQKPKKAQTAPRKNLSQVPEPVAPVVDTKKRSAPPARGNAGKATGAAAKKASPVQEVPKEPASAAPKADKNEVPATKVATATKSAGKSIAASAKQKPKPKRAKNVLRGKRLPKKKIWQRFVIDCACVAEDLILDVSDFEKYLKTHIKIKNKVNQLKDQVTFERAKNSALVIHSGVHFSKRYFKYLAKRYLKKHSLRDWVRVVSTAKDTFAMRYFKIQGKDDDDDVEDNEGETCA